MPVPVRALLTLGCSLAFPAAGEAGPGGGAATPGGARTCFEVSWRTAFERFEPASAGFDHCVADLRAALFEAGAAMM